MIPKKPVVLHHEEIAGLLESDVQMAILLKVNWADSSGQPEPYKRIRCIGGDSRRLKWRHTQAQAIESIEREQFIYYVENGNRGLPLDVGRTPDGKKYLTVQGNGSPQMLLELLGVGNPASQAATGGMEC